jgi:hypothetical protein
LLLPENRLPCDGNPHNTDTSRSAHKWTRHGPVFPEVGALCCLFNTSSSDPRLQKRRAAAANRWPACASLLGRLHHQTPDFPRYYCLAC